MRGILLLIAVFWIGAASPVAAQTAPEGRHATSTCSSIGWQLKKLLLRIGGLVSDRSQVIADGAGRTCEDDEETPAVRLQKSAYALPSSSGYYASISNGTKVEIVCDVSSSGRFGGRYKFRPNDQLSFPVDSPSAKIDLKCTYSGGAIAPRDVGSESFYKFLPKAGGGVEFR